MLNVFTQLSYDKELIKQQLAPFFSQYTNQLRQKRILLKPNLLGAKAPEQAVTTHPVLLAAMIELLQDYRADILLGDSPGGNMKSLEHVWQATGMRDLQQRYRLELIQFETAPRKALSLSGKTFFIPAFIDEIDGIINVPKLKTHGLMLFTGAIKNLFGLITGFQKAQLHKVAPSANQFALYLLELYQQIREKICFHVMDAIWAMDGKGPSAGNRRELHAILASDDAVALDFAACQSIGLSPLKVPTTRFALRQKLSSYSHNELSNLSIPQLADDFDVQSNFVSHRFSNLLGNSLGRLAAQFFWVYPQFSSRCIGCGFCVENCPEQALVLKEKIPLLDRQKCIACLCCHELCPHQAVDIEKSWVAKWLMH